MKFRCLEKSRLLPVKLKDQTSKSIQVTESLLFSSSKESEKNVEIERVSMDCDLSISEFDGLQHEAVLELLAQCIVELSPTQQTVLAMYYHENLEPTGIAACLGLTECEIEQVRVETLGLLRTMLAAQIGLAELPEIGPSTPTLGDGIKTGGVGDEPVFLSQ